MTVREDRFRALFAGHYRQMMAYAARRTDSHSDAEDVVAETFTVAWRRFDVIPVQERDQLVWLYGVARRVLANQRRGAGRAARLSVRATTEGVVTAPPADEGIEAADDSAAAMHALEQLGDADQELLRLALWEELSHAEIAAVTGTAVANVAVRLHRAKRKLRVHFAAEPQGRRGGGHVPPTRAMTSPDPESAR